MASLRLLQIFLPHDGKEKADELVGDEEMVGSWRDAADDDRVVLHLLVPSDEAEPVMDRFREEFEERDGFRIVVLETKAVVPRLEEKEPEESTSQEAKEQTEEPVKHTGRINREELYNSVTETLSANRAFYAMTALSAIVAACGLVADDMAVLVGSMMLAPLMGPNVAAALAVSLGDFGLLRRSAIVLGISITLAAVIAVGFGLIYQYEVMTESVARRVSTSLSDIVVALAAGSAGAFAFTRGMSGSVIGVMVAVALMPPLAALGLLIGAGKWSEAGGTTLLLATNVICINLAGVATFYVQNVRPHEWYEEKQARASRRNSIIVGVALLAGLAAAIYFGGKPE